MQCKQITKLAVVKIDLFHSVSLPYPLFLAHITSPVLAIVSDIFCRLLSVPAAIMAVE